MFTGIVEELGTVRSVALPEITFSAELVLQDAQLGSSIAVNGCCLTVTNFDLEQGWWCATVSQETIQRTTLGTLSPGDRVNLERPVTLADRLGGHLVQGHVDGVATVTSPAPDLAISFDRELSKYVVEKGSFTVDGVSLTVCDDEAGVASFAVIPHTSEVTTLGIRQAGDRVNIEVDVNAKHIERLVVAQLERLGTNGKSVQRENRSKDAT